MPARPTLSTRPGHSTTTAQRFGARTKALLYPAALLSVALAQPLAAQEQERDIDRIYLNPAVGFQYFDDDRDLSETDTYSVGLEYRFLDHWAAEAVYGNADADRKNAPGNDEYKDYRLDGLYYFDDLNTQDVVQPYLAAGGGHTELEHNGETRLNAGGGLRLVASDLISLRLDAREFYSLDEHEWDTLLSLGVSFAFSRQAETQPEPEPKPKPRPQPADSDNDGVPDSRDQCSDTPAGAAVTSNGCARDSDNDGVADFRDQCTGTAAGVKVDEQGCEGVTERVETIELHIQFPFNSDEIKPIYDHEIQEVADFMDEYPDTSVEIAGHSDSVGDAAYNQKLSQQRAEAVAQRLVERFGIASDRVRARGYGESEPIADNSTDQGRIRNRRVEARIEKVIR